MAKIRGRRRNDECYTLLYCKIKNSNNYAVCGIEIDGGANECNVEIPSEFYDGAGVKYEPVVRIEANAFKKKIEVKSVNIPGSVTSVGKHAFSGCKNLKDVQFGGNVTKIDDGAFEGTGLVSTPWGVDRKNLVLGKSVFHDCASLLTAHIPIDAKKISDGLFDGCGSLKTVKYRRNALTSIGKNAFRNCADLGSGGIGFIDRVKRIDDGAFDGCVSLTKVTFGKHAVLTSIGDSSFRNCVALGSKGMHVPASTDTIGGMAFDGCVSLKKVTFCENAALTSIGNSAFRNCTALADIYVKDFDALNGTDVPGRERMKKITFPEKIKRIGDRAFEGCGGLIGVLCLARGKDYNDMSIGNFAFRDCTGLDTIVINKKSAEIGAGSFEGCKHLKNVYVIDQNDNETGYVEGNDDGERKKSDITSIGYRAFYGCYELFSIGYVNAGFGDAGREPNLRFIGDEAFYGCEGLQDRDIPVGVPYTVNENTGWHGPIIGVPGEIEKFMHVYDVDEFSRYHAYDYVHEKFSEYLERRKGLSSEESERLFDELQLPHYLHTFLASWGMLRGSSFLLYKDYEFLKRVCEIVCEERFAWLMDIDPCGFGKNDSRLYIHDILELRDEITYYFEDRKSFYKPGSAEMPIDSVTDTLISKILLATLGCVPAYDTYVRDALHDLLGNRYKSITGEGLEALLRFVTKYKENDGGKEKDFKHFMDEYEKKRKGKRTYGGPDYSVMKYVDMALWGYGYRISGKDEDEE